MISIPVAHGVYPHYAINLARELQSISELDAEKRLEREFGIKSGVVVYLYTGLRDWEGGISSTQFADALFPLVAGIRNLGATPKLLSCSCGACFRKEKLEVAWKLKLDLLFKQNGQEMLPQKT